MKDYKNKTKEQLIKELAELQQVNENQQKDIQECLRTQKEYRDLLNNTNEGIAQGITERNQAEEALVHSEQRWQFALEGAGDGVWDWDVQTNEVYFSHRWKEMLGYEDHEISNSLEEWDKRVHPEDKKRCYEDLEKHFNGETPFYKNQHRVLCKDGTYKWILDRGKVIEWTPEGKPLRIIGTQSDITRRKQAEAALRESERRFREMLQNVKLVAVIMDTKCALTFCNDYLLQLLGWNREDIIGRDWFETLLPPDVRERDARIINSSLEQGMAPPYGESEMRTKSGERRTILWSNTLLLNPDGSSAGFAGIGEDITERRATEKRSHELMQKLESVNRELKDFAYTVSHDLKAPLRGIRSLADWLYHDYQDKFDEEGQEQLNMLLNRTQRMHNLLEGILKYSRLSNMKEENTVTNLNEVIMEAIELFGAPDNITIIIENEMPLLKLERTRILQLFQNLIGNSIKYMDKPNGLIRISCQNQGEFWQFSVQDNGCGIEPRNFDKIFTIFQTLKSRDEFESTGIGLTIVKKIVEMYGGKVWVESKVGEGSTFKFTLPTR
ncbi:MAG: PAS domain S-box protein [Syntrophomonas sp.]|nr:PAS domain S-box protein [Syntrophomonas sp.]